MGEEPPADSWTGEGIWEGPSCLSEAGDSGGGGEYRLTARGPPGLAAFYPQAHTGLPPHVLGGWAAQQKQIHANRSRPSQCTPNRRFPRWAAAWVGRTVVSGQRLQEVLTTAELTHTEKQRFCLQVLGSSLAQAEQRPSRTRTPPKDRAGVGWLQQGAMCTVSDSGRTSTRAGHRTPLRSTHMTMSLTQGSSLVPLTSQFLCVLSA